MKEMSRPHFPHGKRATTLLKSSGILLFKEQIAFKVVINCNSDQGVTCNLLFIFDMLHPVKLIHARFLGIASHTTPHMFIKVPNTALVSMKPRLLNAENFSSGMRAARMMHPQPATSLSHHFQAANPNRCQMLHIAFGLMLLPVTTELSWLLVLQLLIPPVSFLSCTLTIRHAASLEYYLTMMYFLGRA